MELGLIFNVTLMFLVRIGIPLLVLIILGVVIDRWQSSRDDYLNTGDTPTERS